MITIELFNIFKLRLSSCLSKASKNEFLNYSKLARLHCFYSYKGHNSLPNLTT
jgi:hypothetical protein